MCFLLTQHKSTFLLAIRNFDKNHWNCQEIKREPIYKQPHISTEECKKNDLNKGKVKKVQYYKPFNSSPN